MSKREVARGRSGFVGAYIKEKRILDIGCAGPQGFMHRFIVQKNKSSEVIGLDIDINNLRGLKNLESDLVLADAEYLPFKLGVFDCVYMGQLIEHLWYPRELLGEVNRVLREGRIIVIDTPNVYSLDRILSFVLKGKDSLGDPDHKIFYTPASLCRLLGEIGFKVIEITSDKKFTFLRNRLDLDFPPFRWLGSHTCVAAKKVD